MNTQQKTTQQRKDLIMSIENEGIKVILSELDKMKISDIMDTVHHITTIFDLPALSAAPSARTQEEEVVVEEASEKTITLTGFDASKKAPVFKAVRAITGGSLPETKALLDSMPSKIGTFDKDDANKHAQNLKDAGAQVTLE